MQSSGGNSRYPKNVVCNFRKMSKESLKKTLAFYGVAPKKDSSQNEMACLVAKMFESRSNFESEVVDVFSTKFCLSTSEPVGRKRTYTREQLEAEPAQVGEQVAAKAPSQDESSWILGNVVNYDSNTDMYEVQDEDDSTHMMSLTAHDVKRLQDVASLLRKGDSVLAVFPETTSFYSAIVVKNPRVAPAAAPGASSTPCSDIFVRFDDDEDETGKQPVRKVPGRLVLLRENEDDSGGSTGTTGTKRKGEDLDDSHR